MQHSRLIMILVVVLAALITNCEGTDDPLQGSKWLCQDVFEKADSASLNYPDPDAEPDPEAYHEIYGKDGRYEVLDPTTGEDVMGDDVKAGRYVLETKDGNRVVSFDFQDLDGNWTPESERIPYIVKELGSEKFHAISEETEEDGTVFYHETKCVKIGTAD